MTIEATYVGPAGRTLPKLGILKPGELYEVTLESLGSSNWVTTAAALESVPKVHLGALAHRLGLKPGSSDTKAEIIALLTESASDPDPAGEADASDDDQE